MSENAAMLVKQYILLRDKKEEMNSLLKERLRPIVAEMEEIEKQLKVVLEESSADSIKTVAGTFFKKTNTYVTVSDMNEVLDFIKENDAYHLFERKVNKTEALAYFKVGVAIPGLNISSEIVVQIRR